MSANVANNLIIEISASIDKNSMYTQLKEQRKAMSPSLGDISRNTFHD